MQAAKLVLYARANYGVVFSEKQAKLFRQKFFQGYPGIERWHRRLHADLDDHKRRKQQWYVARSLAGRLRYLNSEEAFNEIKNTPSQATGADGLKTALRAVYFRMKKYGGTGRHDQPFVVKMRHHVHDEIITSAPNTGTAEDKERQICVSKDLSEGMISGFDGLIKSVPVTADAAIAETWADKA